MRLSGYDVSRHYADWLRGCCRAMAKKGLWTFLACAVFTCSCGYFLVYKGRHQFRLKNRQLFLLTTLSWLIICLFGSLPLYWLIPNCTYTDAWFETVSALTTTGSTVFSGLEKLPKSVLFWRCIMNWVGGIGIIVMAIAILPALKIGGMKLFKTESSDISREKFYQKVPTMSATIGLVYLVLQCGHHVRLITLAGMNGFFDAITHGDDYCCNRWLCQLRLIIWSI
ncbi:MAG: potassium transporter TrkG [Rheinheimera sp.]|nr:potassium transporter TrkG [Rheinheimera sp.]